MFDIYQRKEIYMINDVMNAITTVGFPIACACALGLYVRETTDRVFQITETVTEALTKQTEVFERLGDNFDKLAELFAKFHEGE